MINLNDFGERKELYQYELFRGDIREVNYSFYENRKEIRNILLKTKDGWFYRTLCENGNISTLEIPSMSLYLNRRGDTLELDPSRCDIKTYDQQSRINPNSIINGRTYRVSIDVGNAEMSFDIERDKATLWDKEERSLRIFEVKPDGLINFDRSFGEIIARDSVICEDRGDHIFTYTRSDNGFISREYNEITNIDSPIEILRRQCHETKPSIDGSNVYRYEYDKYGIVSSVIVENGETKSKPISRYEIEERHDLVTGSNIIQIDSIYPTTIRDNCNLYAFGLSDLWNHDKLILNGKGVILYFEREISLIDKYEELIDVIQLNLDRLEINY